MQGRPIQLRDRRQAPNADALGARDAPGRTRPPSRDPTLSTGAGGGDRGRACREILWTRRQRPRHGGERRRRGAAGALRPRRPHRLRREQRSLSDSVVVILADPEPRRSRARDAPQRLRVRHEPRLVRADPARDRRQAGGAAPATRRMLFIGRARVRVPRTTSSRRTPTPSTPRSPDQAHDWIFDTLRRRPWQRAFNRERHPRSYHGAPLRLLRAGASATPCRHCGFQRRRHDLREGRRGADSRTACPRALHLRSGRRCRPRRRPPNIVADWHESYVQAYQEGVNGRLEPNAVFEPSRTLYSRCPTCTGPPLLPADTSGSRPSSCTCWSDVCSGWTSRSTA